MSAVTDFHNLSGDVLLTETEAAAVLSFVAGTLRNMRSQGRPIMPYLRIGGAVRYRVSDVRALIAKAQDKAQAQASVQPD